MRPEINSLEAWLAIYTGGRDLMYKVVFHSRDEFALLIGYVNVKLVAGSTRYDINPVIYKSRLFPSKKAVIEHCERLLRSTVRKGKLLFEQNSGDPIVIMLEAESRLNFTEVKAVVMKLDVSRPGTLVTHNGNIQEQEVVSV